MMKKKESIKKIINFLFYKKRLIRLVFILPFLICIGTGITIKEFVDSQRYSQPITLEKNIENLVAHRLNFIKTLNTKNLQLQSIYNTVEAIDSQEGISAALYKKTLTKNNQTTLEPIYLFEEEKKYYISHCAFEKNIKLNHINWKTSPFIEHYPVNTKINNKKVTTSMYYLTYDDYLLVWNVRNDFVGTYFVDFEKLFCTVSLALLLNAIISFISLILYYCLENRVNDLIKRRKL